MDSDRDSELAAEQEPGAAALEPVQEERVVAELEPVAAELEAPAAVLVWEALRDLEVAEWRVRAGELEPKATREPDLEAAAARVLESEQGPAQDLE